MKQASLATANQSAIPVCTTNNIIIVTTLYFNYEAATWPLSR